MSQSVTSSQLFNRILPWLVLYHPSGHTTRRTLRWGLLSSFLHLVTQAVVGNIDGFNIDVQMGQVFSLDQLEPGVSEHRVGVEAGRSHLGERVIVFDIGEEHFPNALRRVHDNFDGLHGAECTGSNERVQGVGTGLGEKNHGISVRDPQRSDKKTTKKSQDYGCKLSRNCSSEAAKKQLRDSFPNKKPHLTARRGWGLTIDLFQTFAGAG